MIPPGSHEGWVEWISSFINLRSQRTRANNQVSDEIDLHCGVPQGTVLSPLLFLIMGNEDKIPHVEIYKYRPKKQQNGRKQQRRPRRQQQRCDVDKNIDGNDNNDDDDDDDDDDDNNDDDDDTDYDDDDDDDDDSDADDVAQKNDDDKIHE
ncbi:otolith matrix protein OMM-64-like [Penaeus vannamei]|uniref:otolith matrix protein OMM-64-like n=1 Tax=Penaeus vannamei TaxID=6689 RepID=UPI00387F4E93